MQKSIFTNFHIKEMRVEAQVGTHIKEALEEALNLAKQIKGRVILEWNKMVNIYIDEDDRIEELLLIWNAYLSTRKKRIIVNEDTGEARKIKIIAIRNVRGEYSGKKDNIGYLAKDDKGILYENNFYECDETLPNPYKYWFSKNIDSAYPFWIDIDWWHIPEDKKKKIVEQFPNDLNYCEKHKKIYWKDEECVSCQLEKISEKFHKKQQHKKEVVQSKNKG